MEQNQIPVTPVIGDMNQTPLPVVSVDPNTTPPTNPIKPASKFSIKAIIGIIIFLLLAGGAAAGYVYREPLMSLVSKPSPTPAPIVTITPTPNPTTDWETYIDTQFGYSIKYDKVKYVLNDFSPIGIPDNQEHYWDKTISLCKDQSCELAPAGLGISVYENPNNFSLQDWLNKSQNRPFNKDRDGLIDCYEADSRTRVFDSTFREFPSKEYHFILDELTVSLVKEGKCKPKSLEGGGNFQYIVVERDGKIFLINLHTYNNEEKIILDQILSTFKFID